MRMMKLKSSSFKRDQSPFNESDVAFMQDMIIHHGQSIERGDLIELF